MVNVRWMQVLLFTGAALNGCGDDSSNGSADNDASTDEPCTGDACDDGKTGDPIVYVEAQEEDNINKSRAEVTGYTLQAARPLSIQGKFEAGQGLTIDNYAFNSGAFDGVNIQILVDGKVLEAGQGAALGSTPRRTWASRLSRALTSRTQRSRVAKTS